MENREIIISGYNSRWVKQFEEESDIICRVLEAEIVQVHHVGSTAVPGLPAKPNIDLLVEVHDVNRIDKYNTEMLQAGYKAFGENGIEGRRYFVKFDGVVHLAHVHIFEQGNEEVARHLDFRDFLRNHPHEVEAYAALKKELSKRFRLDGAAYTEAKSAWIKGADERAKIWVKTRKVGDDVKNYSPEQGI